MYYLCRVKINYSFKTIKVMNNKIAIAKHIWGTLGDNPIERLIMQGELLTKHKRVFNTSSELTDEIIFEILDIEGFIDDYITDMLSSISKEDFVIWNKELNAPVESYDTVYHYTSIIELINTNSIQLGENEELVCVASLPISEQIIYSEEFQKNK